MNIVYEDDDLMVINKPAGLVVHPGCGNYHGTLVNAIAWHLKDNPKYDPNDPLVRKAVEISLKNGKFSTASLQTWLGKGHGFVAGLAIWFEEIGVIGPSNGNKPREMLISSMEEFDQIVDSL